MAKKARTRVNNESEGTKQSKEQTNETVFEWRVIGGGMFGNKGAIYKKNQTFFATESEVPLGHRDLVEKVGVKK